LKRWKGRYVIVDNKRNVDSEMALCGFKITDVIEILVEGTRIKARGKGIHEKWFRCGKRIRIAVVEDCNDYWLLRHVGDGKASRKKLKLMKTRGEE